MHSEWSKNNILRRIPFKDKVQRVLTMNSLVPKTNHQIHKKQPQYEVKHIYEADWGMKAFPFIEWTMALLRGRYSLTRLQSQWLQNLGPIFVFRLPFLSLSQDQIHAGMFQTRILVRADYSNKPYVNYFFPSINQWYNCSHHILFLKENIINQCSFSLRSGCFLPFFHV